MIQQFFSSKVKEAVQQVLSNLNISDLDLSAFSDKFLELQYYLSEPKFLADEGWQYIGVRCEIKRQWNGSGYDPWPVEARPSIQAIIDVFKFINGLPRHYSALYQNDAISVKIAKVQDEIWGLYVNGKLIFRSYSTRWPRDWKIGDPVDDDWFTDIWLFVEPAGIYDLNQKPGVTPFDAIAQLLNCVRDSAYVSGMTQYLLGLYSAGKANAQQFVWAFQDQLADMSDNMRDAYDYLRSLLPESGSLDGISLLQGIKKLWDYENCSVDADSNYGYSFSTVPVVDCSPLIPTDQAITTAVQIIGAAISITHPLIGLAVGSVGWIGSQVSAMLKADKGNIPGLNAGYYEGSKVFGANIPMVQYPGFPVSKLPESFKAILSKSQSGHCLIQHPFVAVNVWYDSADATTVSIECFPGSRLRFDGPSGSTDQSILYPYSSIDTWWAYNAGTADLAARLAGIDQDITEQKSVIIDDSSYDVDYDDWSGDDNVYIWSTIMHNMDAFGRLLAPVIAPLQPNPSTTIVFPVSKEENENPLQSSPEHSWLCFKSEPNKPMTEIDFGTIAPLFYWGVVGKPLGIERFKAYYASFKDSQFPVLKRRKAWSVLVNTQAARLRNVFANKTIAEAFLPVLIDWLVASRYSYGYDYDAQSACFELVAPESVYSLSERTIVTGVVVGAIALVGTAAAIKLKRYRRKKLNVRRAQQAKAQQQYQNDASDANYAEYAKATNRYNRVVGSMSSRTDVVAAPVREILDYVSDKNSIPQIQDQVAASGKTINDVIKLISG